MVNQNKIEEALNFMAEAERLKTELRHSWLSSGRRESVAEHSWRLAFFVFYLTSTFDEMKSLNQGRLIKMAIIHDLAEIYSGDFYSFLISTPEERNFKLLKEKEALMKIKERVGDRFYFELEELWTDYTFSKSHEAKLIKALDKIECQIQHLQADVKTWCNEELPVLSERLKKYKGLNAVLDEIIDRLLEESNRKIKTLEEHYAAHN